MRARTLLIASLAINLALAYGWYSFAQKHHPSPPPKITRPFNPFEHETKTNVIVRRLNFTWHEVESADYVAYINNLREIGCPEQTICDIIVADVNQLYAHRREKEILPAEFEWWKSDLDPEVQRKNQAKLRALELERKAMLDRLLGPNWELAQQQDAAEHDGINLNGPVLGDLSPDAKQQVYDLNHRAQQQIKQLSDAAEKEGRPIDYAALIQVRQQNRADLAKILTPAQLEEFLLRYSETAKKMREELRGVSLTPEEFRALFRARDPMEDQLAVYSVAGDATSIRMQQTLDNQREALLRATLGPERYTAYKQNQDPLYQQAVSTMQQAGVTTNLLAPIYQINQTTEAELVRIQADPTLTAEQKNDAVIAVEADREKSLERVLGSDAYQKLQLQQMLNPGPIASGPVLVPAP